MQHVISTHEQLVTAIIDYLDGVVEISDITISDNFVFRIKISDSQWYNARKIDYKLANIVINIQKDLIGAYNGLSGNAITLKNVDKFDKNFVIKVEFRDGCIEALASLGNFMNTALQGMNGKQKVAALLLTFGIVIAGGASWFGVTYLEHLEKIESEKTKQLGIQALAETNKSLVGNKRTPEYITSHISDDAFVEFSDGRQYSKKELKKIIDENKRKDNADVQTFIIDDLYDLTVSNHEEQEITLRKGNRVIKASTKTLSEDFKKLLLGYVTDAELKNTFAKINIQVMLCLKGKMVDSAYIIGIGEPREGAIDIDIAFGMNVEKKKSIEQATLLEK